MEHWWLHHDINIDVWIRPIPAKLGFFANVSNDTQSGPGFGDKQPEYSCRGVPGVSKIECGESGDWGGSKHCWNSTRLDNGIQEITIDHGTDKIKRFLKNSSKAETNCQRPVGKVFGNLKLCMFV